MDAPLAANRPAPRTPESHHLFSLRPTTAPAGQGPRQLLNWSLLLGLALSPVTLQPQTAGALPPPVQLLMETNRAVAAAQQAQEAALSRVKSRGTLPDPKLDATLFISPIETRNGPIEAQIMLAQAIPLWGKLRRDRDLARESAGIAGWQLRRIRVQATYKMWKAWETFTSSRNSLAILRAYRQELESFRAISLTQYATGSGMTQHPVLKLQIEISLIESRINGFEGQLARAENDLQALFDDRFTADIFAGQRTPLQPPLPAGTWLERARGLNPAYRIALAQQRMAVLQAELAVRKNYPDLMAGITYSAVGEAGAASAPSLGADVVGAKIGLNIPLWRGRNKARVQSTRAMVRSRDENIAEVWNRVTAEIGSARAELAEIGATATLYEGQLVQESEQMLASAFAAYETGKISFLDLLDSERMVVRVRLEFEAVSARRHIRAAKLIKNISALHWGEGAPEMK